jgi:DNA-binding response OmpR family regulator
MNNSQTDLPPPDASATIGNLLVVEDSRTIRTQLVHRLKQQGHTVSSAENGRQALEMVGQQSFDLILLDIMMPEMDGYEVLAHLKSDPAQRDIPVIVISALDELESVVRCIEMGATDYLPKQFDPVLLKARISAGLAQRRLRNQELAYLRDVARITAAAQALEADAYHLEGLDEVAARPDALGNLARVFQTMAREVYAREQRLRHEMEELRIQIDEARQAQMVSEITETEYFRDLQEKAKRLRSQD